VREADEAVEWVQMMRERAGILDTMNTCIINNAKQVSLFTCVCVGGRGGGCIINNDKQMSCHVRACAGVGM